MGSTRRRRGERNVLTAVRLGGSLVAFCLTTQDGNYEAKAIAVDTHLGGEAPGKHVVVYCLQVSQDLFREPGALRGQRLQGQRLQRQRLRMQRPQRPRLRRPHLQRQRRQGRRLQMQRLQRPRLQRPRPQRQRLQTSWTPRLGRLASVRL